MVREPQTESHADETGPQSVSFRFDRRQHARRPADSRVTILRRSHDAQAYRHRACSIHLSDMSEGGVGAECQTPLPIDEPVAVFFPPHGADRGFDLYGHVVRCTARPGAGYELGIRFDPMPAA